MSLVELTRNCYQSGVSASRWLNLCRVFIQNDAMLQTLEKEDVQRQLADSVILVFRDYPGDLELKSYLDRAIQERELALNVYVSTFLKAAQSTALHNAATLDLLCQVVIRAQDVGPTIGSIVAFNEIPEVVLGLLRDSLALVHIAYKVQQSSSFHYVTESAEQVAVYLATCVTRPMLEELSNMDLIFLCTENVSALISQHELQSHTRSVLEAFRMTIHAAFGDSDVQMMQSLTVVLGKGDVIGPNSLSDTITPGMVLHHFIMNRAGPFGSGSLKGATAFLVATFHWSSWSPTVFYSQLFVSAFQSLSQKKGPVAILWRSFIIGRLPSILASFEDAMKQDSHPDWKVAMQRAMSNVQQRKDTMNLSEHRIAEAEGVEATHVSLFRVLLASLVAAGLLEENFATSLDPGMPVAKVHPLLADAQIAGMGTDFEGYIAMKIPVDVSSEDLTLFVERVCKDPAAHATFSKILLERVVAMTTSMEVEGLSNVCKILSTHGLILDIFSLYVPVSGLLRHLILFIDKYDCETVGDPQTAVSYLGEIVLFTQYALTYFNMDETSFKDEDGTVSPRFLQTTAEVRTPDRMSTSHATAFKTWFQTLFDSSSDGIEDGILRSSQPKILLQISASLIFAAIKAKDEHKIDNEVLNNGVSFFKEQLLNWTSLGILKALTREVHQSGFKQSTHLDVLQQLLTAPHCPKTAIRLCGSQIIATLSSKNAKACTTFEVGNLQSRVAEVLGDTEIGRISRALTSTAPNSWHDQVRPVIYNALDQARSGQSIFIDVNRLSRSTTPTKLLQSLWNEVSVAASIGPAGIGGVGVSPASDLENCRRIATFVLTVPLTPTCPPLLPIFLHRVLPSVILSLDALDATQQMNHIEILVILISSVMTFALHLELALRGTLWEKHSVLGENIIFAAKRLASDLRGMKPSPTSMAILQRLGSAQSFVSNFPVFMNSDTAGP
ncbi:hypothetical protein CYLTODRAFT_486057 [Cylindrobasidium torrendii FP15055 ss-10]|uniref:Mediator of RNA polymerase II transcription subunit 5 n=1 Tax=Cylindrobasidium torrendii FP15055 ss-10 TaxID=1314674 RepID=A0A0D7BT94_9AGAR|nr:hypothetical protein CYLTODRAFT_486057 [Cylindrobasidium torrendii FP15055 ss-10]